MRIVRQRWIYLMTVLVMFTVVTASGCVRNRVRFEEGKATANSNGIVAKQTVTDEKIVTKIDTDSQTFYDRIVSTTKAFGRMVGGVLDKSSVNVD